MALYAVEQVIDRELVPAEDVRDGEPFFLEVEGDSVQDKGILLGSRVLIKRQEVAENGDIAMVMVDDLNATLKIIKCVDEQVVLIPANSKYNPEIYSASEVRVLGVAVVVQITTTTIVMWTLTTSTLLVMAY